MKQYFTHKHLEGYEQLVTDGYVRAVFNENLVLFNYTDKCTYDRNWNDLTLQSRGIIYDMNTGEVIARPFPKFFNLGEHESTRMANLPKEGYAVWEKLDGSLGIIYYHNRKWNVATRGSFTSEQAIEAEKMLHTLYDVEALNRTYTYLAEIIYPQNRIVVNYGNERKLVMLAARCTRTGEYRNDTTLMEDCMDARIPQCGQYMMTIEECIEAQKSLPKDREGFVVEYESGLRVKIKGDEYMRIAKIISCLSPLSFWEVMQSGRVPQEYLQQIPEEFRPEFEPIVEALETAYIQTHEDAAMAIHQLTTIHHLNIEDYRAVGIFLKENPTYMRYPQLAWPILRGDNKTLDKAIMNLIRPTGNKLETE